MDVIQWLRFLRWLDRWLPEAVAEVAAEEDTIRRGIIQPTLI